MQAERRSMKLLRTGDRHVSRGERITEPGERGNELPDQSYRFVAEDGGRLVGIIDVFALRWRRARGQGAIVLGVRASHHGRGVGRLLLDAAITEARRRNIWRLELTTMTHNQVALPSARTDGCAVPAATG